MIPALIISTVFAVPTVSFYPAEPIQGQPIAVIVSDADVAPVRHVILGGKALAPFEYDGKTLALHGADLKERPATSTVLVSLADGRILRSHLRISERPRVEAPFGIPEKLGGNTPAAALDLVNTLARENESLVGLATAPRPFWRKPFRYPVADPVVTDSFGYSRSTVGQRITHRGTDFRADETTPVFAMNDGVVRRVQEGRNYGKTVVIDHGLGVQTFYMHLSRIDVEEGEEVRRGERVGMAGQTGYAESPHLHLTVRIGGVSIDPVVFLGLFK